MDAFSGLTAHTIIAILWSASWIAAFVLVSRAGYRRNVVLAVIAAVGAAPILMFISHFTGGLLGGIPVVFFTPFVEEIIKLLPLIIFIACRSSPIAYGLIYGLTEQLIRVSIKLVSVIWPDGATQIDAIPFLPLLTYFVVAPIPVIMMHIWTSRYFARNTDRASSLRLVKSFGLVVLVHCVFNVVHTGLLALLLAYIYLGIVASILCICLYNLLRPFRQHKIESSLSK